MDKIKNINPHIKTLLSFILFVVCLVYFLDIDIFIATGFTILILIHEIGHIIALKRLGASIKNFYFIPLLGAFVSTDEILKDRDKIAYFKYMGPLIGTVGVLIYLLIYFYTKDERLLILVFTGGLFNLINLIPISFLDGQGILKGVYKHIEWIGCLILIIVGFFILKDYLFTLLILLLFTMFQDASEEGEGFRMYELILSCIYVLGMVTIIIIQKDYIATNIIYILLSLYLIYVYLKATILNKGGFVKNEVIKLEPLSKIQKYKWFINWMLLLVLLICIVYISY